jgi:hypothetical protein
MTNVINTNRNVNKTRGHFKNGIPSNAIYKIDNKLI